MRTIATYKVSITLDTEADLVKDGYERMIKEGKTEEQIDQEFAEEMFLGLKEIIKDESGEGVNFIIEKFEDLPF